MTDISPLKPLPDVLEFLASRRSRPAKTLLPPVPGRSEVETMLRLAARSPDHGKLEPWRFIVLERTACLRLADLTSARGAALSHDPEKTAKARASFADAHLVVAVIASPVASEKVPEVEQVLSAGAVCLALVNAALASGWGANWLTNWMAFDPEFLSGGLGLGKNEFVAGYIHIGSEGTLPPERPRPDMSALTTWVSE